uniref:Uncharacterized protein LOC111100229 isoform X1 n=1 Tax=Crassostrea virginica TaxID=6565 RepID=A0A8B8A853_CRAVI|nr:uncharacterized protein LOC111100229 isoform X1 [Crassostrea virginica]XP_022287725.1 uncharacterized protein LOC111100229 isoform X1 [Crassostrea virginica]
MYKNLMVISLVTLFSILHNSAADVIVRLSGGRNKFEGRLEVLQNGEWGTVCYHPFQTKNKKISDVICRSLRFPWRASEAYCCAPYGIDSGPIWIDQVTCLGNESGLEHCDYNASGMNSCSHHDDFYISCIPDNENSIRLVGGANLYEGRLEVYHNGVWGTVCDDDNDNDTKVSDVVCRSLGISWKTSESYPQAKYGKGAGPIWLDDLNCLGSESSIDECDHRGWGVSNCRHYEDLSIRCIPINDELEVIFFNSSSPVVHEGKDTDFNLLLQSNKSHECLWFHNGYLITNSSSRYRMSSVVNENGTTLHTLHIGNVLQRDQGEWKIKISNDVDSKFRNVTIRVIPRLVLRMTPQYDLSIQQDDVLAIECTVETLDSLTGISNGFLVIQKDELVLPVVNKTYLSSTWNKSSAVEDDSGRYTCWYHGYPDHVHVSVNVTVIKPEQYRCKEEISDGVLWGTTIAEAIRKENCPLNQNGIATRYCKPEGVWGSSNLINCTTEAIVTTSLELDSIIEDGIKDEEKINSTLRVMKNMTTSSREISAGDLISSMDILEKIVDVTNSTGSTVAKEVFYSVVNDVLSSNNSKTWASVGEKADKDASLILKSVDRLSKVVFQNDNITATQFTGSNFELTINEAKIDDLGIRFPDFTSKNVSDIPAEDSTFLELPKQDTNEKMEFNYVAVIYKSIAEIITSDSTQNDIGPEDSSKKKMFVNSQVLSLTTQTDLGLLSPPLNLTFRHIQKVNAYEMQAVCVSWNFTVSKWSERGCKLVENNHRRTVCQCNHLTNFAILMRPYSMEQEDKQSLKTMSLVGVILSIAFTVLTFTIYILTWRFIKSDQSIMMLNLCAAMVIAYAVFISAVERTENEKVCIAITAILHYLFLVTFLTCWD